MKKLSPELLEAIEDMRRGNEMDRKAGLAVLFAWMRAPLQRYLQREIWYLSSDRVWDASIEAMTQYSMSLDRYYDPENPLGHLYTIAIRRARDLARRQNRSALNLARSLDVGPGEEGGDGLRHAPVEEAIAEAEPVEIDYPAFYAALHECARGLSDRQKQVALLMLGDSSNDPRASVSEILEASFRNENRKDRLTYVIVKSARLQVLKKFREVCGRFGISDDYLFE